MITVYFRTLFWNLKKIFTQRRWGQIIVGLAYFLILGCLFAFIYFLGLTTFNFLNTFSEVSQPVIRYILLSALAFTGFASVLSFLIAFSERLFEKRLASYFITGVASVSLFQAVFWENFLLGGWPLFVLALPLLMAFLTVGKVALGVYPLALILFALLTVLTESLGALLALSLRYYFGKASKKIIYLLLMAVFFLTAVILKNIFLPSGLSKIAERPALREVFVGLSSLPVANPYLPTTLFFDSLSQNFNPFLIFVFQVTVVYLFTGKIVKNIYRITWQKAQEGIFLARPHQTADDVRGVARFYGVIPSLFKRESLLIERSPAQLLYLAFVIFLALIYLFLLAQSPRFPEFSPNLFPKIIALTLMIIGYFTTMVALRFSFPSLVGDFSSFWTLSRLPKIRQKILLVKWLTYTFVPLAITLFLAILAFLILRLPFNFLLPFCGFCLGGAIFISALNFSFGAVWAPSLPREDIEQTTTALPAVMATLLSVLVSLFLGALFYPLIKFTSAGEIGLASGKQVYSYLGIILFSSLIFLVLTFYWARRKFGQMDIR